MAWLSGRFPPSLWAEVQFVTEAPVGRACLSVHSLNGLPLAESVRLSGFRVLCASPYFAYKAWCEIVLCGIIFCVS